MYLSRYDIANLYSLINEGIEQKIPKLLNLVSKDIENKEEYIKWAYDTFDPTPNAEYITWILRMLSKGFIRGEEDSEKVKERLTQFQSIKIKPFFPKEKRDINRYKNYSDLAQTIDEFKGQLTKGEQKRKEREEGIQHVDNNGDYSLYIVTTSEAAANHFRRTDWCVRDPRHFESYGPPFYYITKDDRPYKLIHLDSKQSMDVYDRKALLDDDERELMTSEYMKSYIEKNDNSKDAIDFYENYVSISIYDAVDNSLRLENERLDFFTISNPLELYDELEYISEIEAYATLPLNLKKYEDFWDDDEFLEFIRDKVLSYFDIYLSEGFNINDMISEDGRYINVSISEEFRGDLLDGIDDIGRSLVRIENNIEDGRLQERFDEEILESSWGESGFGKVSRKIKSIDNLNLKNFKTERGWWGSAQYNDGIKGTAFEYNNYYRSFNLNENTYATKMFDIVDSSLSFGDMEKYNTTFKLKGYLKDRSKIDNPFYLLAIFLSPLLDNGITLLFAKGGKSIGFAYNFSYDSDLSEKDYIRQFKTLKSIDKHMDSYLKQIKSFYDKFITPNVQDKTLDDIRNIFTPEMVSKIKLPFLKMVGRKESSNQMHLDLHEKVSKFDEFFNRMLKYKSLS